MTLVRAEHVCRPWPNLAPSEAVGDPCSWIPWELGIPGVQIFFFFNGKPERQGWK